MGGALSGKWNIVPVRPAQHKRYIAGMARKALEPTAQAGIRLPGQRPNPQADAQTIGRRLAPRQTHKLSSQTPDSPSRRPTPIAYLVDARHPVQATSSSDTRPIPRQTSNSPGRRPTPRQTPKSPQSHARRPMQTTHSKEKGAHGTNPDAKLRSRYAAQHGSKMRLATTTQNVQKGRGGGRQRNCCT